MVIWIVWNNNFHGVDEFCGVFSTEEKAQEYIWRYSEFDQQSFRIEMSQLDAF